MKRELRRTSGNFKTSLSVRSGTRKLHAPRIQRVEFCASPDVHLAPALDEVKLPGVQVTDLALDRPAVG